MEDVFIKLLYIPNSPNNRSKRLGVRRTTSRAGGPCHEVVERRSWKACDEDQWSGDRVAFVAFGVSDAITRPGTPGNGMKWVWQIAWR